MFRLIRPEHDLKVTG